MSRELRLLYKNVGFVAQMSNNRYDMNIKRAQLQIAQIRLIVKEQDRGLLGRRHR